MFDNTFVGHRWFQEIHPIPRSKTRMTELLASGCAFNLKIEVGFEEELDRGNP